MASSNGIRTTFLLLLVSFVDICIGSRKLTSLYQPALPTYHHGALLEGDIPVSIVWYGDFTPAQKSIVIDFLLSLTPHRTIDTLVPIPSVSQWWRTVDEYVHMAGKRKTQILLTNQISHPAPHSSLGSRFLKRTQVSELAAMARPKRGGLALVLTSADVAVEGFCMDRCGFHSSEAITHSAYIWVGNSASQCPGLCAWPFHQPIYGPQNPPLLPPNNDVGLDGMVINIATLLAGTVTNSFGNGFFQGPKDAPVEVAAACPGVFGKGAYPGYAGHLLVDHTSGASYNANGLGAKKYLLPAMFDPSASSCSPLV